jgi:hypothetical protein
VATAVARPPSESTVPGKMRAVVVPSPSCPLALPPQQRSVPEDNTAQVWPAELPDVATDTAKPPRFTTAVGEYLDVVVPLPKPPDEFSPQH